MERIGILAPLAFVALQIVQVILAPIPGQTLAGGGGYLFGTLWGTVYSMIGVVLGVAPSSLRRGGSAGPTLSASSNPQH
jgi:uncharacterized membrane protein YdjX (TVP38/TMEM64 family)